MIRITHNVKTQSYTVSGEGRIVRNIPVRSMAEAVRMDIRHGFNASFGDEQQS